MSVNLKKYFPNLMNRTANRRQKVLENWLTYVQMYAHRGCLEEGTEISKPADAAFVLMSRTQWARPPATAFKPEHAPF